MYTQVFPSPRGVRKTTREHGNKNGYQNSKDSMDHCIRQNDSGASSMNSISDQTSINSRSSDTLLLCRTLPLDVPVLKNSAVVSSSGINVDSGIVDEHSYSSGGSDHQFIPMKSVPYFLGKIKE